VRYLYFSQMQDIHFNITYYYYLHVIKYNLPKK